MKDVSLRRRKLGNRRPTNVSLAAELIEDAKRLDINVSQACEQGLAAAVKKALDDQWIADNWDAIQSSNAYVEKHGLPLTEHRMW